MDPCPQQGTLWRPRVHAELRAAGTRCSRRRVARLMHEAGIQGKVRKRYKSTTQADAAHVPVEDLVRRNFDVSRPITVWAVDMSYLPTKEGWLYLAVVLDSHARLVVGWSMGAAHHRVAALGAEDGLRPVAPAAGADPSQRQRKSIHQSRLPE
ncbi:IS3 family transposase [Deinococcus malanensis]